MTFGDDCDDKELRGTLIQTVGDVLNQAAVKAQTGDTLGALRLVVWVLLRAWDCELEDDIPGVDGGTDGNL